MKQKRLILGSGSPRRRQLLGLVGVPFEVIVADVDEDDRYGLIGLVIGLQNKDLKLITENLLSVSNIDLKIISIVC